MNHILSFKENGALKALYDSLTGVLQNLHVSNDFSAYDDTWIFVDEKLTTQTLDFNFFNDSLFIEYQKIKLTYNDEILAIDLKLYVKLLFLHTSKSTKNINSYSNRLNVLKMFFTFFG
jgi:hypothetical protein